MVTVDTAELAVLALAGDEPTEPPGPQSAVELGERLEMSAETMADRITLISALSDLEEQGLVEASRGEDAGRRYALTDRGREHAQQLYETVRDQRIEVRNGTRTAITLAGADRYLPEPALARALARLTDDGVLYLKADVEASFVDRNAELDVLSTHYQATSEGTGRPVLVTGAPGVGKTCLIEEWLDRTDTGRVLTARCHQDVGEPFQAIREAIEPALESSPFDRPDVTLEDASNLQNMRRSIFADVADDLLELATAADPVVVYLDDLHNADEPSLELLAFLADRLRESHVMVITTCRLDEPHSDHQLEELVQAWTETVESGRIDLQPLGRDDTRELIEQGLGTRPVPAAFADVVFEHTGGNALYVEETLAVLQEAGELIPEHDVYPDETTDAVSDRVEATIERRLDALDDEGREVIAVAALLGDQFDHRQLAAVVDLDEKLLEEYLDLLIAADVLQPVGAERETLQFQSGLFRETVIEHVPADRRNTFHRRIATALSERYGEDPAQAATVAYHYEKADEGASALSAWRRAAEYAASSYAQELALDHYERALARARERNDSAVILELVESIGDIAMMLGNHDRAGRAFAYVRNEAAEIDHRQQAAAKLARYQQAGEGNSEAALSTVEEAFELRVGDPATPAECRLLIRRANIYSDLGEGGQARADAKAAISLARQLDESSLEVDAIRVRIGIEFVRDFTTVDPAIIRLGERAVTLCEELGNDHVLGGVHNNLGLVKLHGDLDAARGHFERSLDLFERIGDRTGAMTPKVNLCGCVVESCLHGGVGLDEAWSKVADVPNEARSLGSDRSMALGWMFMGELAWQGAYDYEQAVGLLEQSIDVLRRHEPPELLLLSVYILGAFYESSGDLAEASAYAEEATELGRTTEDTAGLSSAERLCGQLALDDEEVETARDAFGRAVTIASDGGAVQEEILARAALIDGLLATERLSEAHEHGQRIADRLNPGDDGQDPAASGPIQRLQKPTIEGRRAIGRAACARAEYARALEAFEAGLRIARDHDDRLREASLRFELARLYQKRGEDDRTAATIATALAITDELDAFGEKLERDYSDVLTS